MGGSVRPRVSIFKFVLRLDREGDGNVQTCPPDPVRDWKRRPSQDCLTKTSLRPCENDLYVPGHSVHLSMDNNEISA